MSRSRFYHEWFCHDLRWACEMARMLGVALPTVQLWVRQADVLKNNEV